jgi:hypothetical protein
MHAINSIARTLLVLVLFIAARFAATRHDWNNVKRRVAHALDQSNPTETHHASRP